MKEKEQNLTDRLLIDIEGAEKNDRKWRVVKNLFQDDDWRMFLEASGVDLDRIDEWVEMRDEQIKKDKRWVKRLSRTLVNNEEGHIIGTPFLKRKWKG